MSEDATAEVVVRRSARRRRTVSAHWEGERIVVLLPARLSAAEERRWVSDMVARLQRRQAKARPSDADLAQRAQALSSAYLGGAARPASVRWVGELKTRWGSCTPADRTIRLSSRLQGMPQYVVDYVLLHELAHLLEHRHDARFWGLLAGYPRLERARGYLDGVSAAASLGIVADDPDDGRPDDDGPDEGRTLF